jgi:thiol:disulfide interchange protein/DsbC/DsbD-like thiol-disulfide interchange protein
MPDLSRWRGGAPPPPVAKAGGRCLTDCMRLLSWLPLGLAISLGFQGVPQAQAAPLTPTYGPATAPHIQVELVAAEAAPAPGQEFWAGVLFQPDDHWHIYWKNSGDSGTPPTIKWKLPEGASAGEIQWPAPRRLSVPPLMDYGYEGPTLLMVPLKGLPATATATEIGARVDWLVCEKVCIPGKAELRLKLPAASPRKELFERTRARLPKIEPGLNERLAIQDLGPELALELPARLAEAPVFFPAESGQIDNPSPQRFEKLEATADGQGAAGEVAARLMLKKSDQLAGPLQSLKGLVEFGPPGKREAVEIEVRVAGGATSGAGGGWAAWLQAILFAFVGGLILNLMPCVFPVLSIKVLAFMSQKDHEIHLQRRHALVYALGIVLSFWLLTGVLLALRAAGEQIGWGFQLQSPGFVAVLACGLFFFGLNLAGVFEIGGSVLGLGQGLTRGEGYVSSFFTGVLATVVATPCTAPFMGSAIGFALAQPVAIVFAVFTALALGLAVPYVALAWFPSAGRHLPRPGRWMETFKQAMAFPVFGTVVWLVWVFGLQTDVHGVLRLLSALLLLGLGAWAMGRYPGRVGAILAACLAAAALYVALSRSAPSKQRWEPYSAALVSELRAKSEPVFIDFTAAWCVSCKVNELVALSPRSVLDEFERKKVRMIKGDWTTQDPQITEALRQFGRSGVPFYVLYYRDARGEQVVTLPEVLTPRTVLDALARIPE